MNVLKYTINYTEGNKTMKWIKRKIIMSKIIEIVIMILMESIRILSIGGHMDIKVKYNL